MNFPTLVYRTPGPHFASSGTYRYLGVADDLALDKALADGWFLTLGDALAGEASDDSAPTRAELETKAAELAIKFDGRTTDRALAEKIDTALAQGE